MCKDFDISAKIYPTENSGLLSALDMLRYFSERGAFRVSDLHLKVSACPAYRIDGNIVKLKGPKLTSDMADKLIYPLFTDEKLARYNRDCNVDCSYKLGNLQFRINVFKDNDGLCAAIRALSMDIPDLEDLGFPNTVWQDIAGRRHGLVLLTGITGAGKSTTIASFIKRINETSSLRILSIEDPIEYLFQQGQSTISQLEVGRDTPSFDKGLQNMLRQDPDIIFVGEMRDPETILMTLMAAETGHLVFSTLHTRDVTGSITRIMDYFPAGRQNEIRNQLSLSLAYIVCQKLVPRKDNNGRLLAMEILNNNYGCANLIRHGKIEQIYSQLQIKTKDILDEKMITMESHLSQLVKTNKINEVDARQWANDIKAFDGCMQKN